MVFETSFSFEVSVTSNTDASAVSRLHIHFRGRSVLPWALGDRTEDPNNPWPLIGSRPSGWEKPGFTKQTQNIGLATMALHLQNKLKVICQELKACSQPCPVPTLPFSNKVSPERTCELNHWGKQNGCERDKENGQQWQVHKAQMYTFVSVSLHQNANSWEPEPHLPRAATTSLRPSRMLLTNVC